VIRQLVADAGESADPLQHRATQRDRRTKAAAARPKHLAQQRAWQKRKVDMYRAEPRPQSTERHTLVEAGHGTGAGVLQRPDGRRNVVAVNPHVAIGYDEYLVLGRC